MNFVRSESIKVIAEMVGIPRLSDEIADALVPDVEFRLREIAGEAVQFMKHSKRTKLTTDDITNTLRCRRMPPVLGHSGPKQYVGFQRVDGSKDIFVQEEFELATSSLPSVPARGPGPHIAGHWLTVEGLQPATAANPPPPVAAELTVGNKRRKLSVPAPTPTKPLVKQVLSQDQQEFFERVTGLVRSSDPQASRAASASLQTVAYQPLVPYFVQFASDQVLQSVKDERALQSVLGAVESMLINPAIVLEPYAESLIVPVLTCATGRTIGPDSARPPRASVPENEQDGPGRPPHVISPHHHWSLRSRAAVLLGRISLRFSRFYAHLLPRLVKTLLATWLDMSRPLPSQYGAIRALGELGAAVIQSVVVPNIGVYMKNLDSSLKSSNERTREEAAQCLGALQAAAAAYMHEVAGRIPVAPSHHEMSAPRFARTVESDVRSVSLTLNPSPPTVEQACAELVSVFGDSIVPFVNTAFCRLVL
eukprot:TRINITY_DN7804_c0_g2_i1.p1 TRINITY_DN7804_c0_g2~~TRINITY_DN7804_c0_g2_i1.p1  ORF type:complete len:479 (+),score=72.14 TRINITY_DN7804_c0_g2_i1:189-1625(+)